MEYSYLDAIEQLKTIPKTPQTLLALIRQVSVEASGAVTVLYGGNLPNSDIKTSQIADAWMKTDADVRILDKTDAARLLKSTEFLHAVADAFELSDAERYAMITDDSFTDDVARWLFSADADAGPWAEASKRFAQETVGEVRLLISGSLPERTFNQVELPALLQNPAVTRIDGYEVADLKILYPELGRVPPDTARLFDDLKISSLHRVALGGLDLVPGPDGKLVVHGKFLDPLLLEEAEFRSAYPDRVQAYNAYLSAHPETRAALEQHGKFYVESSKNLIRSGGATALKAARIFGAAGGLLTFSVATNKAAEAEAAGRHEEAKQIMAEWAADAAGSEVGRIVGAAVGAAAVGVAAVAGVTLSAPLAGAVVLGAALAGALFGAEAGTDFYRLLGDRDANGRRDIVDKLSNLLFGATSTISSAPTLLESMSGNFAVDAKLTQHEIAAKAQADIAWRFALRELNSFVAGGISYDQYNADGSLDLVDPETGTGSMSQEYLTDRAAMLAWKLRYEKLGATDADDLERDGPKPYNEDWDTSQLEGNWDYVDLTHRLPGGAPLELAIDGTGISLHDHQIVFGSAGNN